MIKTRILFVINPISGGKRKTRFVDQAERYLDKTRFDPTYLYTEGPNEAGEMTKRGVEQGFRVIVAVGGDGTINEVARHLLDSPIVLGVIPYGSGNGFARSLNIPLKASKAIQRLNTMRVQGVDSGTVNDTPFFNMGGLGFDAEVSLRFAQSGNRGILGYMLTVISTMLYFKPRRCKVELDGNWMEREVFMLSIANSPQFGNGAYIAPHASMQDGLLDLCFVYPFPLALFPKMVYHLFNRTAHKSRYVECRKIKVLKIEVDPDEVVHLDGEPRKLGAILKIKVLPKSLKVIF